MPNACNGVRLGVTPHYNGKLYIINRVTPSASPCNSLGPVKPRAKLSLKTRVQKLNEMSNGSNSVLTRF